MGLIFEPSTTSRKSWTVRTAATGEVLGSIEWLYELGGYGFGPAPGSDAFSRSSAMTAIGDFIESSNAGADHE